jgi:hypothetical protein
VDFVVVGGCFCEWEKMVAVMVYEMKVEEGQEGSAELILYS